MECLNCDSKGSRELGWVGANFRCWACDSCGFQWIDREDLRRPATRPTYEDYPYNASLRRTFEEMKPLYVAGLRRRLAERYGTANLDRLAFLDVGCANGEYLWAARTLGFGKVFGIEIDPKAAENARQHGEVHAEPSAIDSERFDVIQIKNVVSNIADFQPWLKDYVGRLESGGLMLLDVLNQSSLTARLRQIVYPDSRRSGRRGHLRPPYVINGFSKRSFALLCERSGLRVRNLRTSHLGSMDVPYASGSSLANVSGRVGSWIGRGSMLISEADRAGA